MSKVYVISKLQSSYGNYSVKIFGVLSNEKNAQALAEIEDGSLLDIDVDEFELDDPELLNRIAKGK